MTPFWFTAFEQREKILNLIEAASGGRMTPSYFRIGGLMMDLPAGFERRVKQFLDEFPGRARIPSTRSSPATRSGRAARRASAIISTKTRSIGV